MEVEEDRREVGADRPAEVRVVPHSDVAVSSVSETNLQLKL